MANVQIGWRVCHTEEWIKVPMCFQCQKSGHGRNLQGRGKKRNKASNADCKTKLEDCFCLNCGEKGLPDRTRGCLVYRVILAAMEAKRAEATPQRPNRRKGVPPKATLSASGNEPENRQSNARGSKDADTWGTAATRKYVRKQSPNNSHNGDPSLLNQPESM